MPYKYADIEKRLRKLGWFPVRQKGSHVVFLRGSTTVVVPKHGNRDVSPWVERAILKRIGLNGEEFRSL